MLKAIFWDYQEDSRGAWLKCHIPNELIDERFLADVMYGEGVAVCHGVEQDRLRGKLRVQGRRRHCVKDRG